MRILVTAIFIFGAGALYSAEKAQFPSQEQLQAADTQLNQVYQQLRGTLNDAQKQQLKLAQREWIKKRDALAAANQENPQDALYQATLERVAQLKASSKHNDILTNTANAPVANQKENIATNAVKLAYNPFSDELTEDRKLQNIEIEKAIRDRKSLEDRILPQLTDEAKEGYYIASKNYTHKNNSVTITDLSSFLNHIRNAPVEYLQEQNDSAEKYKNLLSVLKKASKIVSITKFDKTAEESIKIFPPAAMGNTVLALYNKKKNQIITVDYSKRYNWDFNSTIRIWDVSKSALVAEVEIEGTIIDVLNKNEFKTLCLVTGPIHHKSGDNIGLLNLDINQLYGKHVVKREQITLLNNLNPSSLFDRNIDFNQFCETNTEFVQWKGYRAIYHRLHNRNRIVKLDDGYCLYPDGSLYDANKKIITRLGGNSKPLEICAAAISNKGNKIYIMSINSYFIMDLEKLDLSFHRYEIPYSEMIASWEKDTQKQYPSDSIETMNGIISFLPEQNDSVRFILSGYPKDKKLSQYQIRKGYIIDKHGVHNITEEIVDSAKLRDQVNVNGAPGVTVNTISRESYIDEKDNAEITFTVGKSPPIKVDIKDVSHSPYIESAAMLNSSSKVAVVCISVSGASAGRYYGEFDLVDIEAGTVLQRWRESDLHDSNESLNSAEYQIFANVKEIYLNSFSKDHSIVTLLSNSGNITTVDINSKKIISQSFTPIGNVFAYSVSNDGSTRVIIPQNDGSISLFTKNIKGHLEESLRFYPFEDGSWFLYSVTDNFYSYSKINPRSLYFSYKDNFYPFEQYDAFLNRPDILLSRLNAPTPMVDAAKSLRLKKLKRAGLSDEAFKADYHLPEVAITSEIPDKSNQIQINLAIKAEDSRLPISRIKVFLNSVPLNIEGQIIDQKTQSIEKTIPIKLAAGRNKIQVSVLNSAGAESLYANAEVNCTVDRSKPKLYAVAMGVSQYDRPEWCLKYAAKDATDLIGKLKAKAGSSYSEVKPLLLTDKEVTKESAAKIKEFLSTATIDDTVLIFMAGHGLLDDQYDYYFGTTDIDPAKPSERGMAYEAIDNILAEVPSLKKALLMDTCHAGELDEDEKKDLAASDGSATPPSIPPAATNSSPLAGKVAMRSIGTRGMTVKAVQGAKGKSDWYEKLQDMFVDLRRGSGATVISSSQGAEYAFESSEQSNGLFTYALMEALDGKATPNKDGQITISSIGDYVKKRVQDLTKGKQNPNLRGVNLEEDFVLGTAK